MKLMIFLFLPMFTFAGLNMERVNSILLNINASKELKYYSSDITIHIDKKVKLTSIDDADILLFATQAYKNKMLIVNSYKELLSNKNCIGAIYLKKKRTQIIFIKERLENRGLSLPKRFNNYIIPQSILVCHTQ